MTDNKLFKTLYKQLNKEQKEAVDAIEGPVMVIAGPGTGKTQTLTLRIANILLKTQVNPENILALTFTENAVQEMRSRLLEIIGTHAYRVSLYTFHSFATEIIRAHPEDFERIIGRQPATDLDQMQIIEQIVEKNDLTILKPFGDPAYYLKHILTAIDQLKKDNITPTVFEKALKQEELDLKKVDDRVHEKGPHKGKVKAKYKRAESDLEKNKEFLSVYKLYEKMLFEKKLFDYNDMLVETVKALEKNSDLLLELQEKYQYFLIDEHQDTNSAQNKIVELLASYFKNPNLFVVGDEKQAIFRFQGASLENFLYFKNLYKEAKLINLQINYRSNQEILDTASSLIKKNKKSTILQADNFELIANRGKETKSVYIAPVEKHEDEYLFVAGHIKKKLDKGVSPAEIAVLARNNADLPPLMRHLSASAIDYTIETDQNTLDEIEIKKLILLLKLVDKPYDDMLLTHAMHIDFLKIHPLDIYRIKNASYQKKISMWEIIAREIHFDELDLESEDSIKQFYSNILRFKTLAANQPFDDVFVKLIGESRFLEHVLKQENAFELLDKVTRLYDETKLQIMKNPSFSLSDFLELIETIKKHKISLRKTSTSRKNAVRLMTAHRAKGLEFENVYIIGAYDGHWGNMRSRSTPLKLPWHQLRSIVKSIESDENEDERRLFYVALTRAKKEVVVSYSKYGLDDREQLPSQFVEEMKKDLLTFLETQNTLKKTNSIESLTTQGKKKKFSKDILQNNKQFFKDMFVKKGFSVSALNNYMQCPWKFFFRNLLTLPDVKDPILMYGTAAHYAINRFAVDIKSKKKPTEKDLMKYFEHILTQLPLTDKEREQVMQKGKDELIPYYQHEMKNWTDNIDSELVIRGVKFADDVILTGRLDLIEKTDKDSEVIVHDFKTGSPKGRAAISTDKYGTSRNYKRQLVFYKILLDRYHDNKLSMKAGVIDFVKPTSAGNFKKEVFAITKEEVEELEKQISDISKEILDLKFWNTRCEDPNCEYCELRDFMGE